MPARVRDFVLRTSSLFVAILVAILLASLWEPLGPTNETGNLLFTFGLLGGVLLGFQLLIWCYEPVLRWCLTHKFLFLLLPASLLVLGLCVWLGFQTIASPLAKPIAKVVAGVQSVLPESIAGKERLTAADVQAWQPWVRAAHAFPGLGNEFMPPLDEGSFLLMPVTMAHA